MGTRGIVFGQEFDKLIVQATASEVQQFALGRQVDVYTIDEAIKQLERDGLRVQPMDDQWGAPIRTEADGRKTIMAQLKTRCGCTKDLVVEYPPPDRYRIPLHGLVTAFDTGVFATPSVQVRTFELTGVRRRALSTGPNIEVTSFGDASQRFVPRPITTHLAEYEECP